MTDPLLVADQLTKRYVTKRNIIGRPTETFTAVDDVSFSLPRGSTVGIVGESGAGKSTVARMVLRLIEPDSGSVTLDGVDILRLPRRGLREMRSRAQMIFQDPFSSLDPRMVAKDAVGEALTIHGELRGQDRDDAVLDVFRQVGMRADHMDRYPHEFSGGQLQRIAIARALATQPELIVCDEPVAALDLSIQAQVLNLLLDLQEGQGLSYLFISHDLSLVRFIAHHVVVMYQGRIVEQGPTEQLFSDPQHDYTKTLLGCIPDIHARSRSTRPARAERVKAIPREPRTARLSQ
jgi:oligopeptide transport system ATP-binding protein